MSELHGTVTRNLRVLMAIRGIPERGAYKTIAAMLGVDPSTISLKLNGKRAWSLEDIEKLANEFRVRPEQFLGDTAALIDPPREATGTVNPRATRTRQGGRGYSPTDLPGQIIPFPQVTRLANRVNGTARIIAFPRATTKRSSQTTHVHTRPSHPIISPLAQVSNFLLRSRANG